MNDPHLPEEHQTWRNEQTFWHYRDKQPRWPFWLLMGFFAVLAAVGLIFGG